MYTLHKTVHPPTGIDNALYCHFISAHENNLITFSANKLQVHRITLDKSKLNKTKLEFVQSFQLYGNICAIRSCRYGSMKKDALVLAFADAKASSRTAHKQHSFTRLLNSESLNLRCLLSRVVSCSLSCL